MDDSGTQLGMLNEGKKRMLYVGNMSVHPFAGSLT
jgi:hypothetical protein